MAAIRRFGGFTRACSLLALLLLAGDSAAKTTAKAPRAGSSASDLVASLSVLGEGFALIRRAFVRHVELPVLAEGALAGMLEAADPTGALASTEPFEQLRRQASRVRSDKDWIRVVARGLEEAVGQDAASDRLREVALGGMRGMLNAVDPNGSILAAADRSRPRRTGIGARVEVCEGVARVVLLEEGGPAERAGLRCGDQLIRIDGRAVTGMTTQEVAELLPGAPGTVVRIGVGGSDSGGDAADLEIARDEVRGPRSPEAEMIQPGIGYLRLPDFPVHTVQESEEALQGLAAAGMGKLVLDLRDNGGGLLEPAIHLTMRFLERDRRVVSMRGRLRETNREYRTSEDGSLRSLELAVLVNGGTSSAAEILAGALQDHGRGPLVGTRTFGRASVQTVYQLSFGNVMALTTSQWYTPNGRSVEPGGLLPDIVVDEPACRLVAEQHTDRMLEAALKVLRESP